MRKGKREGGEKRGKEGGREEERTSFSLAESLCKSHIVYKIHIPDIFFKVSRFNNKARSSGWGRGEDIHKTQADRSPRNTEFTNKHIGKCKLNLQ